MRTSETNGNLEEIIGNCIGESCLEYSNNTIDPIPYNYKLSDNTCHSIAAGIGNGIYANAKCCKYINNENLNNNKSIEFKCETVWGKRTKNIDDKSSNVTCKNNT